jgi:hypothetical protein
VIGIYQDSFVDYLKDTLGFVKVTSKNLITVCPWCEYNEKKDHYHMYISLEAPIFHCFHGNCEKSGTLRKMIKQLEGHDISDKFIDQNKIEDFKKQKTLSLSTINKSIQLPQLNTNMFPLKEMYIQKRFKFANMHLSQVGGLIFDVYEFIRMNNIAVTESLFRIKDYLQSNFVGFLTEHETTAIFRNIDETQSMRYYKIKISDSVFTDYYKLNGNNPQSKDIVIAEGIFDIFSDYLFDILGLKNNIKMYASVLSSKYIALIKSIIFHEQIFHPNITILSDRGIELNTYKKMKKYNSHIIDKLTIYYNKAGKDFNDTPVIPVKYIL